MAHFMPILHVGDKIQQSPGGEVPVKFHFNKRTMRDSIYVQELHDYVNDDEKHEAHPHLEDFLIPCKPKKNGVDDAGDEGIADKTLPKTATSPFAGAIKSSWDLTMEQEVTERPKLKRPLPGILHNANCPSRHVCHITEARRRVTFNKVTVRDYAMILGDHPYCRMGPPVTLGWEYIEYEPLFVNEYELHHSLRRPLKKMYLTVDHRKDLLNKIGLYTRKEINKATKIGSSRRKRKSWQRFF